MEMVECSSIVLLTYWYAFLISLLRSLALVRRMMRRNLAVYFSRKMAWQNFIEWLRFNGYQ